MKITMYGSFLCQDCIYAVCKLKDAGVEITFKNITSDLGNLKEFMKIRENSPMFDMVKENNGVGIPYMIFEDGTATLDYKEVIKRM